MMLAALAREALDRRARRRRLLGTFSTIGGLDLVAERLLDVLPALVVLVGIAEVADRADIDPAGLELVGLRRAACRTTSAARGRGQR